LVAGPVATADSGWLRRVLDEHAAYVGRALRYLGVPERDLPDACQEVFVIVARRGSELRSQASLRAWLYGISINVARNARRTRQRRPETLGDPALEPSIEAAQEDAIVARQQRELALRLLDRIDDAQREVLVLHDVEELPMREITDALGIPLKTGYSRLRLARAALARAVAAIKESAA
jgi:RNA polymerase sigma-70 factor (ECF subfamily)